MAEISNDQEKYSNGQDKYSNGQDKWSKKVRITLSFLLNLNEIH